MELGIPGRRTGVIPAPVLWTVAGLAATFACVLWIDRPVATWSHAVLHRPAVCVLITKLAELPVIAGIAFAALAVCVAVRVADGPPGRWWRTALTAALATLLAIAAAMLLKHAAGRLWPETWVQNNPSWIGTGAYGFFPLHGGRGWGSFPSGHTARVTAPCAVLWQRVSAGRAAWAALPTIMAAVLVACDFHFVGDCVGGACVGVAAAAIILRWLPHFGAR